MSGSRAWLAGGPGRIALGALPFAVALGLWVLAPQLASIPPYKLPPLQTVWAALVSGAADGTLLRNVAVSLYRLGLGFLIGNALAIPLGIAIAVRRDVAEFCQPVLSFFQSIAGIAWVPLAIIWFGVGIGAVIFIIANTIFFASIYNTVLGVRSIPPVLYRAVRAHGASPFQVLTSVVLPGALTQIILGLRTSMAFGWRALIAGEMVAGTSGLGYTTIEAVQWYQTEIIVLGMILIGVLWLVMDRVIFVPIERATIRRWGLIQR